MSPVPVVPVTDEWNAKMIDWARGSAGTMPGLAYATVAGESAAPDAANPFDMHQEGPLFRAWKAGRERQAEKADRENEAAAHLRRIAERSLPPGDRTE